MITTSDPAISARVTHTVIAAPDVPIDFQRKRGYYGETRTIRLARVKIVWSIDLMADKPEWAYHEKVVGVNVKKDGSAGAPVEVWEYDEQGLPEKWAEVSAFVKDAIEKSRPANTPTVSIDLGV